MSAASRIEELKRRYEENPRRFFAPLANEYRKSGDIEQAIALCQAHLQDQSTNMNGHVVYGQALFDAGRYGEAKSTFQHALELDPENLIALRHLGDIARAHGESGEARQWYARVLDADPRNDEILAILGDLTPVPEASSSDGSSSAITATYAALLDPATPVSDRTAARDRKHSIGTRSASDSASDAIVAFVTTPQRPITVVPASTFSSAAAADSGEVHSAGLMDLNLDLGGAPERVETPAAEPTLGGEFGDIGLMFGAATPPSSPVPAPAFLSGAGAAGVSFAAGSHASLDPGGKPNLSLEPQFDQVPASDPDALGHQHNEPPKAFVTETMAELYLQQGFRDEGLSVLRQIAVQRPGDVALRQRIKSLEAAPPSQVAHAEQQATTGDALPRASITETAHRTARDFFARIASRSASGRLRSKSETSAGSAPDTAPSASVRYENVRAMPSSLDAFFGEGSVSVADEHVGRSLSADTSIREASSEIRGKPTQLATSELSLDALFGDASPDPHPNTSDQLSRLGFDEFFASPSGNSATDARQQKAGASPTGTDAGSAAELEQFQDWLQQLKKP